MKLNVAYAKLIMGLVGQNPNVSDKDALAFLQYNPFDVKDAEDKIIVAKETVREIAVVLSGNVAEQKGLQVGDEVEVMFNKELVVGPIKTVKYQVEGAGSKQYEEKDIKKL